MVTAAHRPSIEDLKDPAAPSTRKPTDMTAVMARDARGPRGARHVQTRAFGNGSRRLVAQYYRQLAHTSVGGRDVAAVAGSVLFFVREKLHSAYTAVKLVPCDHSPSLGGSVNRLQFLTR